MNVAETNARFERAMQYRVEVVAESFFTRPNPLYRPPPQSGVIIYGNVALRALKKECIKKRCGTIDEVLAEYRKVFHVH